jgi:predicted ATPase
MGKSYATQIALQPLGPEESLGVVHSLLGPREVADPLVQLVLAKAEGNPFFIEELACAAGERGDLFPDVVPETIQDVLLARIERLSDDAKRLLQAAAIVGRVVPLQLLRAVWDEPERSSGYSASWRDSSSSTGKTGPRSRSMSSSTR